MTNTTATTQTVMTHTTATIKTDSRSKMDTQALRYPNYQQVKLDGSESMILDPSIFSNVDNTTNQSPGNSSRFLSFACRQGKVITTEYEVQTDLSYSFRVLKTKQPISSMSYGLPVEFVRDRIHPIVNSGSPAIFFDRTSEESKINNINPPPITGAEVNGLTVLSPNNIQKFTKMTGLSVRSNNKGDTVPQKFIKSIAGLNLDYINYADINYDAIVYSKMDCKGKGYAEDLYYEAGALEAFACQAKSDTQTPQVVIAACGKDEKMHVAPFITKQFQNAVTSFTAGETYTCHAPDPVWVRYKYYANKQGITEDRMTLSTNIYPEITKVNLPVTACKPDIATKLPLQDCFVRTLFDEGTVARLASETKDPATLQEIVNNPITNIAQVSSAMYATNFMEEDAIQPLNSSNCPNSTEINTTITDTLNTSLLPKMPSSKSNINSVVVQVLSVFVAIATIAAVVIAISFKFGSEKVISAGRSRLNQCRSQINELRQNNCLTGSEDVESQIEEEDQYDEQNTCARLAQTCRAGLSSGIQTCRTRMNSGIQNFRKRLCPEMQEVPQNELSSREQDTSCTQDYLSSLEHCTPLAKIKESTSERVSQKDFQRSVYLDY